MRKIIDPSHFLSLDVVSHARNLLGKKLVTFIDGRYCAGIITETEAYRAPDDKACHAYQNKRTPRTEIMFGAPGYAYVYLCYGIHNLLNVVTGPKESAHAVLIRSIQPTEGIDIMLQRRGLSNPKNLANGPGN